MANIGHCKHGEFDLDEGCQECVNERLAGELKAKLETEQPKPTEAKKIVKVRYISETTKEVSPREYTYSSEEPLQVGDIVTVPVRDTIRKAKVSTIDVPEAEIKNFRDKVKVIPAGSIKKILCNSEEGCEYQKGPYCEGGNPDCAFAERDTIAVRTTEGHEIGGGTTAEGLIKAVAMVNEKTAVIAIAPEVDERVLSLYDEGVKLHNFALSRVIKSDTDMVPATEDLALIARLKRAIEEKRKEYADPIRNHLDAVNSAFKNFMAPLLQADELNREKLKAYKTEVERRQREAEEINRQKLELARREAELSGTGEFTVDLTPVAVPEAQKRVHTDLGSTSTMKTYKWEVVDLSQVPKEYLIVNAVLVGNVVRASKGSISIAGIRIYAEDTIRVNTRS